MTPIEPIPRGRVYEQVAAQIEQQILDGELTDGDKLPTEPDLAELFGVSRSSVREAIKSLVQKGLVEVRRGRGTFVVDSTSDVVKNSLGLIMKFEQDDDLEQLVEVREILEPAIAARAADRATDDHIAAMREAVETMDASLGDPEAYIEADNKFHLTLAEATQNRLIIAFVESIVELLQEQRFLIVRRVEEGPERAQHHHKDVLHAVLRHDVNAARTAMEAHLQQVREDTGIANLE